MAMGQYRFIGTEAQVGGIKMNRFGQRFSINDNLAHQSRKGGAQLLTEDEFASFKFTDNMLKIWADPFVDMFEIPAVAADAAEKAEFLRKRDAALLLYRDIRQGLLEPESKYVIEHKDGGEAAVDTSQPEAQE